MLVCLSITFVKMVINLEPTNLPIYQATYLPTYQCNNQSLMNLSTYLPTYLPIYLPTNPRFFVKQSKLNSNNEIISDCDLSPNQWWWLSCQHNGHVVQVQADTPAECSDCLQSWPPQKAWWGQSLSNKAHARCTQDIYGSLPPWTDVVLTPLSNCGYGHQEQLSEIVVLDKDQKNKGSVRQWEPSGYWVRNLHRCQEFLSHWCNRQGWVLSAPAENKRCNQCNLRKTV